ncbi:MAG: CHAT domain-containing protein [Parafilimonas sp.]
MYRHSISGYVTCIVVILSLSFYKVSGQDNNLKNFLLNSLNSIENNNYPIADKLERLYVLKKNADQSNIEHDSIYSRLLLKIGSYEIQVNKNYNKGLNYIESSIAINKSKQRGSSKYYAAKGYYALAYYYNQLNLLDKASTYYDSTINIAKTFADTTTLIYYSKLYRASIFIQNGDYQKAIEESTTGIAYAIKHKDSTAYLFLLDQRAQALYYEDNLSASLSDINKITNVSAKQNNLFELASVLKLKAFILQKEQKFFQADSLFKKAISIRNETKIYEQVANDYIDYGNFYLDSLHDYKRSKQCYDRTISFGEKLGDSILLSKANVNIAEIYLQQNNYEESLAFCIKALKYLNPGTENYIYQNPSAEKLSQVSVKELSLAIMSNKVEILLRLYCKNKNRTQLAACLQTALVTDTLITKMRNIQSGTESKLYWRNYTRGFYANAIEATYLAGKTNQAFYFMEKSRSVLLNDKLNELGAAAYLSAADAAKQENYQIKIIETEQKLSLLKDTSKQYQNIQLQLITAKNDFGQFIKSLEQKYPAYYQYKYADEVPSLQSLQKYLAKNNQSFVHYFLGDSVTYILGITSKNTKLIRLSKNEFDKEKLNDFIELCSNRETLNNHYNSFALLSNSIYQKIFQPLQLSTGRVIICSDNTVIPFDALCTDATGKNFLLNNYTFSYVYSARFLLKQFNNSTATGNFIGFAPVSFAHYLGVADLTNAANALNASAAYYTNDKLFTHQNATRNNFFNYATSYSIVSIFSHARADTTDNEPVLFMQDSLIHLSELQLLNDPATKLVLLSACQTNVGKNATGEGIYSLARGFATAGIPSVAATLWNADEQTIYAISEKFNEYLSKGMSKDEALQKAKLYFIQENSSEKMLPYYWANMILIGNTDAINFTQKSNYTTWIIVGAIILLIAALMLIYTKRKSPANNN